MRVIYMSYTLKDIAREANVSISAVSLVLNDKPCRISYEKKELIKQIAKENNYTPNINEKRLKLLDLLYLILKIYFFQDLQNL
jgi:LacI family transcriptional regulator